MIIIANIETVNTIFGYLIIEIGNRQIEFRAQIDHEIIKSVIHDSSSSKRLIFFSVHTNCPLTMCQMEK